MPSPDDEWVDDPVPTEGWVDDPLPAPATRTGRMVASLPTADALAEAEGTLGAFATGVGRGATMGFNDEIVAALESGWQRGTQALGLDRYAGYTGPRAARRGMDAPLDTRTTYDRALEAERARLAEMERDYGSSMLAGDLVGTGATAVLLPSAAGVLKPASLAGKVGVGMAEGATLGAVEGAGRAEGDRLEGAITGAQWGAGGGTAAPLLGAAAPAVGRVVGKVADKGKQWISDLVETANRARVGAAGGSQNLKAVRRIDRMSGGVEEFGADLKRYGIGTAEPSTGARASLPQTYDTYLADAVSVHDQAGAQIGALTEQLTAEGVTVSGEAIGERLRQFVADQFEGLPGSKPARDKIIELANEWADKGPMTYDEAHRLRVQFDRLTDWDSMGAAAKLKREIRSEIQGELLDQADNASPELRAALDDANRKYAVASGVIDMAEEQARRESRNLPFGLMEALSTGSGATIGGGPGAIAGGLAMKTIKPRMHDIVARTADQVADKIGTATAGLRKVQEVLQTNPEAYGRFGPVLARAAARGPEAFASAHYVLSQQEPEFRGLERQMAGLEPRRD